MKDPAKRIAEIARRQQAKPAKIPTWPDDTRASPPALLRAALFPALPRGPRPFLNDAELFSVAGVTVRFTGLRFDQSDLDVWLEIIHAWRGHEGGREAAFTAHSLLLALGKQTGGSAHRWLHDSIKRLSLGLVEIITKDRRYWGHLIEWGTRDDLTLEYVVSLNPELVRWFRLGWSGIDIDQRRRLRGSTARALHAYYSTHKRSGFHAYVTLAGIVGLEDSNPRRLKARIKDALEQLVAVDFAVRIETTEAGATVHRASRFRLK